MVRFLGFAAAMTLSGIAVFSSPCPASDDWPYPQDTPVIEPVSVGLAGEQPTDIVRYLLARGPLGASISPDGKTLAYGDRVTGEPQLWTVSSQGGWPTQLTFGSSVRDFSWSPDGESLLITRDTNGDEREGYYLISKDGTRETEILPPSDAFRSFGMFSKNGEKLLFASTERNGLDFDIYIADAQTGEQRMVYEGSFGFFAAAWQPGGDLVIVDEIRGEDGNDVYLLNVETGDMNPLFQPEVSASHQNYQWLPDGSGFYLATNQRRDKAALAFYDLKSQELRFIETPDGVVEDVALSHDGRYLAWVTNVGGISEFSIKDLQFNQLIETPVLPEGSLGISFAEAANSLVLRVNTYNIPGDVLVWDLDTRDITRAYRSSLAGINPATLVAPQSLTYEAQDGEILQGFLYQPRSATKGQPAPVVVRVHGGPTAQSRTEYRGQVQYLVNKGIAVFDVNVRGSTGSGKRFSRLDNQEKRLDSVRDLVDTVAFLDTLPAIDANRAAVMGGSYGGYMVNAVLGAYPDVFKAGASFVGVTDWVRALQTASPGLKASDRIEYGDIREQRWIDFYSENSPINTADKIKAALFVEHGVNDPRDPVDESDLIVKTVRDNGFDVTYLRFPDEGHGISKQVNRVAFNRALAAFLEKHLLGED